MPDRNPVRRDYYSPRCNGEQIIQKDAQECQDLLYEKGGMCGATPSKGEELCKFGTSRVTLRVFASNDNVQIHCHEVAKTMGVIWMACANRGGSAQTPDERLVLHMTE